MSESFAERMRRLRREAPKRSTSEGPAPGGAAGTPEVADDEVTIEAAATAEVADGELGSPEPAPAAADPQLPRRNGPPVWLKARLQAKAQRRGGVDAPPGAGSGLPKGPPGDPERLAELPGGGAERLSDWSLAEPHGACRLERALEAPNEVLVRVAKDPALQALDPSDAVYFDIETTGLSGGAGTYPYLIALARFRAPEEGGGFEVWQGFMRSPADEPGMLRAAAERIAAASGVVTFFGKSFDRHRVEDKLRQHGIPSPFEARPHLDLYHPCKRLYGGAYTNGKLQTMERELLGFTREHDLSGAYAPEAWFDYVAGRPHRLEEVFRHNLLDVVSLAALTGHLGAAYDERFADGADLRGSALHRARGWAKLHGDARERAREREWLERAAERTAALGDFATLARRQMQFDRARSFAKDRLWSAAWEQLEALLAEPEEDGVRAQALAESARLSKRCGASPDQCAARARLALELARKTLSGRARSQVEKTAAPFQR